MRKLFLLVLLFSTGASAQMPKDAVALEDAVFDKSFTTRKIPSVKLRFRNMPLATLRQIPVTYTLVNPFNPRQSNKVAVIGNDGTAQLVLDYPFPNQQIFLSIGELFYGGIYANTDLVIDMDMKVIQKIPDSVFINSGVHFLGTDGPLNAYMAKHALYKQNEIRSLLTQRSKLKRAKPAIAIDSLLPAYDKITEQLKKIDDDFFKEYPSKFSWLIENERMSQYYADICSLFWGKKMDKALWEKMSKHKVYVLSNQGTSVYEYMAIYLSTLPSNEVRVTWDNSLRNAPGITKEQLDALDSLKGNLNSKGQVARTAAILQPIVNSELQRRKISVMTHMFDSIFSPAKADILKIYLNTSKDLNQQTSAFAQLIPTVHTQWIKAVMEQQYRKTSTQVNDINSIMARSTSLNEGKAPGIALMTTPFGASLYKASRINAKEFIAQLKESFPGKAIVIDRWATWCTPCLQEMPHSKALSQDSKDLPVTFVYLCTVNGSSESAWKTKLGELQLSGTHYLIDAELDAELSTLFSFNGYPGYAFIDKKGKYQPGAIDRISSVDKKMLTKLVNAD